MIEAGPAQAAEHPRMSHSVPKRRVVIVGAIRGDLRDGRIGGQAFACRSLMSSRLAESLDLHGVDSSIDSIKSRSGLGRLPAASRRFFSVFKALGKDRRAALVLFCSHGLSFIEKGVMALCARAVGARVLLLPRSGHLTRQIDSSVLFRAFARRVFRSGGLIVCQSPSWLEYFQGISGHVGEFRVLENWLPDESFAFGDSKVATSAGPEFVVGYFNRIEPEKGIFDFLEAVRRAHLKEGRIRGIVYGDGSAVESMQDWIRRFDMAGVVEYRGWLGEEGKRAALRGLDAYLFASHVEGFPNSLLEVLSMKVPVISVRVGAVGDLLRDGESALLAESEDVEALSSCIERLSRDETLRRSLAENAYARISGHNTLGNAVNFFEEVLS